MNGPVHTEDGAAWCS